MITPNISRAAALGASKQTVNQTLTVLMVATIGCCISSQAFSQDNVDISIIDDMQAQLQNLTQAWQAPIKAAAINLLFALAGINLLWQAIQFAIKTPDMNEFLLQILHLIMLVGFFLAVINYAGPWSEKIVDSFAQLAAEAGQAASQQEVTISVSATFTRGLRLAHHIYQQAGFFETPLIGFIAVIILLIYSAIAAYQMLVLAELYIISAAGVIFLGFAGTQWTIDIARKYMVYVLSVGAKLFGLYLITGLGEQLYASFLNTTDTSLIQATAVMGMAFILMMLVTSIPAMLQSIVNGSAIGANAPNVTAMTTAISHGIVQTMLKAGTSIFGSTKNLAQKATSLIAGSANQASAAAQFATQAQNVANMRPPPEAGGTGQVAPTTAALQQAVKNPPP